ncbi:MAG: double zinc ribbon domain-containing protein [Armatimonadota bacterium]
MTELSDGLLDLVYPKKCLVCGELGEEYLCAACSEQMEGVPRPYCVRCGHPLFGRRCSTCRGRIRSFEAARAAGIFTGSLRDAIHAFKYGGHRMLARPLAEILAAYLTRHADIPWERADRIVPVPIHPARKRLRGYNQSELLAGELSSLLGLPVALALHRIAVSDPQVDLSGAARRENVRGIFRADADAGTVLLVDDVATTCSTLHECSLALLASGVERVYAVCLAFD